MIARDVRVPLTGNSDTSALLYSASRPAGILLVFAHGAGAGHRHPFIVEVAATLAAKGIDVLTFNFPYMEQRRRAPDRPSVLDQCFEDVLAHAHVLKEPAGRTIYIGGKSMGGRIATHLAARQVKGVRGVAVLGYPLHPPGRPDQLRTSHLPGIHVPLLIVQGERDAFGTPAELRPVLETIRASVTLHVVEGGDHSLAVGRRRLEAPGVAAGIVAAWLHSLDSRP